MKGEYKENISNRSDIWLKPSEQYDREWEHYLPVVECPISLRCPISLVFT